MPVECPLTLRKHKHLSDRWPISNKEHESLRQEVRKEFGKLGIEVPELRPGDDFQPCYLDIPSRPRADFLWSGLGSVVVSQRIKQLLETLQIGGIKFCSIILRKVGKREARLPAPIPTTGEPEDIIDEVALLKSTDSIGPYFELLVQSKSGYVSGEEPVSVCSGCGRETFPTHPSELVMTASMWNGEDIFRLASSNYIVVTDTLKKKMHELKAKNVRFEKLPDVRSGIISLQDAAKKGTPEQRAFAAAVLEDMQDSARIAKALANQSRENRKKKGISS